MAAPTDSTPAQLNDLKRDLKAKNQSERIVLGSNAKFYDDDTLDCLMRDPILDGLSHYFNRDDLVAVISGPTNAEHELDGLLFQLYTRYSSSDRRMGWGRRPTLDFDRTLTIISCDGSLPQLESLLDMDVFDIVGVHSELSLDVINTLHTWREALPNNDMQWTRCSLSEKPGKHCITYCLKPSRPSWAKASDLQPDVVNLRAYHSPLEEVQACVQYFFDAPTHRFHTIDIKAFNADVKLPVLRTQHLYPDGAVTLSPGTSVERCDVACISDGIVVGDSCFQFRLTQLGWAGPTGWDHVHRLPDDTQCAMLTLRAQDLQNCLRLPDHPLLQHVRMLRFHQDEDSEHDIIACKSLFQRPWARFPRLVAATAVLRKSMGMIRTQAQPLLNYYTVCQHGLILGDYGMLLRHEDLQPDLRRILLLYIAATAAGLEVPDAVSRVLLREIVVLRL